jgi:tetratricopeptide (TPR) repeat protein/CHAT domain-containing protein
MMGGFVRRSIVGAAILAACAAVPPQVQDDPEIRAAVDRFFAAQEAEDAAAYLSLWSTKAPRAPRAEQLKFIFESGDDRFSDIAIARIVPVGELVRVLVSVKRERTDTRAKRPDGTFGVFTSTRMWSLTFAREAGGLKLLSEGVPADDLANALLEAPSDAEREQLLTAEPELVNDRLVTALSQRAAGLAQNQQLEPAQRAYRLVVEIARRVGNKKAEGEALQSIGNALYFQRDFAGALASYTERLAVERSISNDAGIAYALLGIATIRYSQFEYADALAGYSEALSLYEKLDDEPGMATALVSTGNIYYLQADYEGAIRDYRRSRELSRKLLDTAGEARALEGLGRVYTAQGDYAAALEAFAGVAEEGRARGAWVMRGNASESIGDVHFRLGNLDTARAAFAESRNHFTELKDVRAIGRLWRSIALTDLVSGRFPAAEQAYSKSRESCAKAEDADCVARAIVGLAFALQSQERYDEAAASYRKAMAAFIAQKLPADAARAEIGLSQTLFGKKDFSGALAAAIHARQQSDVPDILWRAHVAEGRARRRLDQAPEAMASARAAIALIQSEADSALRQPSLRIAPDTTGAYGFMAVLQAEAGDAAGALTTLEERQVHALRIALATNERDIVRGLPPDEREAERRATASVVSLQTQIERERELPKPDIARINAHEARLGAAIADRTLQQQNMFKRWPELRIWRGLAPAVTPDEAAAALPPEDGAIVSWLIDEDDVVAVTLSRSGDAVTLASHTIATSRKALAEAIAEAITPEALRDVTAWRAAAADLLKLLPSKAIETMSVSRRVLVVPDDVLWRVPFEALPHLEGYIGDRTEIAYASSITAIVRSSNNSDPAVDPAAGASRPAAVPLMAIGAPELPAAVRARVKGTAPSWTLRAGDAAEREVRAAAAQFTDPAAVVLTGQAATEAAFRAGAPVASSLHIALPFRINSASPLFSPMLWSENTAVGDGARPNAANDGVLEVREVMNLDLRARVAVLSDGAALSMRDAAAATGVLQWAWRAAGVPAIVLARWAADEPSTEALLADFQKRVGDGEPPGAALQEARTAARAREATRAPWFWAQFMVVGR